MKRIPLSVLAGSCVLGMPLHAQSEKPNIVFIMADDLGWNDLSVMGSDYYETLNIDKLASEGVLFDNAYAAAANSAPSRACFMTGLYTPRHGVYTVSPSARGDKTKRKLIPIENAEDVRSDFVTLGEALKQQGYTCGHVGKWHLGSDLDDSHTGPLSQGFDYNIAGDRAGSPYSYFYPYCRKQKCHLGLDEGREGEYLTDRLTSEAIKFMGQQKKDKPFFLYMAHHAVHTPLKAPQTLIEKYQQKAKGQFQTNPIYAAMVEKLDWNVGRLCHALDSLGLSENTLIVFFSDNGGSEPVTDNFRLRGGKETPYEGGSRVPLIMRYPGKLSAGTVVSVPIIGVDFYPTLVSLAGGVPDSELDGENIFDLLKKSPSRDREIFWHFPAYLQGYQGLGTAFRATPYSTIRSGEWKLIYYYEDKSVELFNLKDDRMETTNLSELQPAKVQELRGKLSAWLKATHADIPERLNPAYRGDR